MASSRHFQAWTTRKKVSMLESENSQIPLCCQRKAHQSLMLATRKSHFSNHWSFRPLFRPFGMIPCFICPFHEEDPCFIVCLAAVEMSVIVLEITFYVSMGVYSAWAVFAMIAICGVSCVSNQWKQISQVEFMIFRDAVRFSNKRKGKMQRKRKNYFCAFLQEKRCLLLPWMVFTGVVTGLCIWGIISVAKDWRKYAQVLTPRKDENECSLRNPVLFCMKRRKSHVFSCMVNFFFFLCFSAEEFYDAKKATVLSTQMAAVLINVSWIKPVAHKGKFSPVSFFFWSMTAQCNKIGHSSRKYPQFYALTFSRNACRDNFPFKLL